MVLCQCSPLGHMKLCLSVAKAEVTTGGQRRRGGVGEGEKHGNRGCGYTVTTVESIDTDEADCCCRQPAVTTAPVCCKLKRIRGPTIKTMTSVQHHMTPCNKKKMMLTLNAACGV